MEFAGHTVLIVLVKLIPTNEIYISRVFAFLIKAAITLKDQYGRL